MIPEIFKKATSILKKLEDAGHEAYFVGGSVRDYLLKRDIHDVDIATSAQPEEVKKVFPKTVDVGIEHGTILVLENGEGYEVTTFRTESEYKDYRRPDSVVFIRSLIEDLKRRDFTINAIAMDYNGFIQDPFNGLEDLKANILRTVGSPIERFTEDALRMMRAVRFVSQLNFTLEEATCNALKEQGSLLQHIAVERITTEFEKLLDGKQRQKAISIMVETELYQYLPNLKGKKDALLKIANINIDRLTLCKNQMWLLLLYLLEEDAPTNILKAWKLPTKQIKELTNELSYLKLRVQTEWDSMMIYQASLQTALNVEAVYQSIAPNYTNSVDKIKEIHDMLPIHDRSELAISGHDLTGWKKTKPGPWLREYIEEVEHAVINKVIDNEKESIKEWLRACNRL